MYRIKSMYNGWKNYETWVVQLHLSNDQCTYNEINSLVELANGDPKTLARSIKRWVGHRSVCVLPILVSDLENSNWDDIDWVEIAKAWI